MLLLFPMRQNFIVSELSKPEWRAWGRSSPPSCSPLEQRVASSMSRTSGGSSGWLRSWLIWGKRRSIGWVKTWSLKPVNDFLSNILKVWISVQRQGLTQICPCPSGVCEAHSTGSRANPLSPVQCSLGWSRKTWFFSGSFLFPSILGLKRIGRHPHVRGDHRYPLPHHHQQRRVRGKPRVLSKVRSLQISWSKKLAEEISAMVLGKAYFSFLACINSLHGISVDILNPINFFLISY